MWTCAACSTQPNRPPSGQAIRPPTAGRSLGRKTSGRSQRRTVVVFCEGARTEPDYLKALKADPAVNKAVSLEIDGQTHGSAPLTLVAAAADFRARTPADQSEVDEVWCIFDVESPQNHPNLKEAVALARDRGVKVAISNPCFELWLLLHFQDHSAWLDNRGARRELERHDGIEDKSIDGARYMPLRDRAIDRARDLARRHEGNGTEFPRDNPSSGMYRFLEALENLATEEHREN